MEGLVIPAVINLYFELKHDGETERHLFAFVCHMSDISTRTVLWAFMVTEELVELRLH